MKSFDLNKLLGLSSYFNSAVLTSDVKRRSQSKIFTLLRPSDVDVVVDVDVGDVGDDVDDGDGVVVVLGGADWCSL